MTRPSTRAAQPVSGALLRLESSTVPRRAADTLARVAASNAPILCIDCYGRLFARVARAVHQMSGRQRLISLNLRLGQGESLALALAEASEPLTSTLAVDGVEFLSPGGQDLLCDALEQHDIRLISGTAISREPLRAIWRAERFAVLSTVTVGIPVLSRRGADLPEVIGLRLRAISIQHGRPQVALAPSAEASLIAHPWPGDLDELDAVLTRTVLGSDRDLLEAGDLCWDPEMGPSACSARSEATGEPGTRVVDTAGPDGRGDQTAQGVSRAASVKGSGDAFRPVQAHESLLTVETLAVELAHQLKNPMVTVKTFAQNAANLASDANEFGRFRALTEEAIARMDETLEELLAFARLGEPRKEQVDALAALQDALRSAWSGFASKQLSVSGPNGATLPVRADASHLRFALRALTRHVLESIEARTTLRIEIEPPGALRVSYRESGVTTHLRGVTGEQDSLPLALMLVRGALARADAEVELHTTDSEVMVGLLFRGASGPEGSKEAG